MKRILSNLGFEWLFLLFLCYSISVALVLVIYEVEPFRQLSTGARRVVVLVLNVNRCLVKCGYFNKYKTQIIVFVDVQIKVGRNAPELCSGISDK